MGSLRASFRSAISSSSCRSLAVGSESQPVPGGNFGARRISRTKDEDESSISEFRFRQGTNTHRYGFTMLWFSTIVLPGADHAAHSASSLSAHERTVCTVEMIGPSRPVGAGMRSRAFGAARLAALFAASANRSCAIGAEALAHQLLCF